jgi:hypothetical protein
MVRAAAGAQPAAAAALATEGITGRVRSLIAKKKFCSSSSAARYTSSLRQQYFSSFLPNLLRTKFKKKKSSGK